MPFSRSKTPYFHHKATHKLIQQIAEQESLVIYAGAGVSIDRTGMSWRELMSRLMEDRVRNPVTRQSIMEIFTPQQAASIVRQMYSGERQANLTVDMVEKLRQLLYLSEESWQRGGLLTAIVNLAATFHDRGKRVRLVTTNYDNFLGEEVELLNVARKLSGESEIKWEPVVVDYGAAGDRAALAAEKARCLDDDVPAIIHLHGYVPQTGDVEGSSVILSEKDYFHSQELSTGILAELFSEYAVLVVGASLTDPPLLSALARTMSRGRSRPRFAVMPLQAIEHPQILSESGTGHRIVQQYTRRSRQRMSQFNLRGTFPDFYGQVPQLLTEVRIAMARPSPTGSYVSSPDRYGLRLTKWWDTWHGERDAELEKRQSTDHELLRRALCLITDALGARDETMKLEIWMRWEPCTNRLLKLWASSTGTWPDFGSMRQAEIRADSKYVSVRTFCLGMPKIYKTSDESSRWRTHLCVPVRMFDANDGDFPVGVISLASFYRSDKSDKAPTDSDASPVSKIGAWNGAKVAAVVTMLRTLGEAIARPKPLAEDEVATLLGDMLSSTPALRNGSSPRL